jgi:AraC-like DNA-binding protein
MTDTTARPGSRERQPSHRGRRSSDEIQDEVGLALRVVDDPDALCRHRLAQESFVAALAERRYGRVTRLTRGCALRDLLKVCLDRVADNSNGPFADFARAYAEQTPIARIARQLGMSRPHLSRAYRTRLVAMVADELVTEIRQNHVAMYGSVPTNGR